MLTTVFAKCSLITVQHKNYLVASKAVKIQEQNCHYQAFPGHRYSFQSDLRQLGRPRTSEATAEQIYVSPTGTVHVGRKRLH